MSAEKWRVVTPSEVLAFKVTEDADGSFTAIRKGACGFGKTRRFAVGNAASCSDLEVVAILAPGELTPDERVTAERERCAAIAERVARESDATADALADKRIFNTAKAKLRGEATIAREIAATIRKGGVR